MTTIILLVIGFLVGLVVRPMLKTHKHDYELLLHKKLKDIGVPSISYKQSVSEEVTGYKINFDLVYVSYKKCKTCNHTVLSISNGTNREFCPDWDFVQDKVQLALVKDREEKDQELFEKVNMRLAERDSLTSPEKPYPAGVTKPTVSG